MEKDIKISNVDISIKAQEGSVIFEIKNPKRLQKELLSELKEDYSQVKNGTIVIYPEQKIIDSQRVFLENTSRFI